MATHEFDSSFAGRTLTVEPGDDIVIVLDENPTTGYQWSVVSFDSRRLTLVRDDFAPMSCATGAGGKKSYQLRAGRPGRAGFSVKLWRAWSGESSVIDRRTFSFRVTVGRRGN